MWIQCKCGNVIRDNTNRHLLSSYLGEDWKGHITAIWDEDVKVYCPHKGMIYIDVNKELPCYCYEFDDYKQFEEKYYGLLDELKDHCLKYSTLRCNGTVIHKWEL